MLSSFICIGIAVLFLADEACGKSNIKEAKHLDADVVVVGGGTAGVVAAIQAGRSGCKTILIEKGSQLGGTMTTGGVNFPGLFHAYGKQIIKGIGWELVSETIELNGDKMPDFSYDSKRRHWTYQIRINPFAYAALAEEKCIQAGVSLRYYEIPVSVSQTRHGWKVETIGDGVHCYIDCRQLIDATGDADVVAMAGFKRLKDEETQPGSLIYGFEGIDVKKVDMKELNKRFDQAIKDGVLKKEDAYYGLNGFNLQNHILGASSATSEEQTRTNIEGRASMLRLFRFLKSQPGLENIKIKNMQPETGVRETYRIVGNTQVTVDDYTSGRVFEDAVAYSFYPIDLHVSSGVSPKMLQEGVVATIPLGALIPKGSRNMIVAGRCISSDRLANSALRVQASCMAMGQAAGATAALACKMNVTPAEVPVDSVRELLVENNAIVPESK